MSMSGKMDIRDGCFNNAIGHTKTIGVREVVCTVELYKGSCSFKMSFQHGGSRFASQVALCQLGGNAKQACRKK